jgi:hypothetical protein
MAWLIRATSGQAIEVLPRDRERGFTLFELYALIGGGCHCIETFRLLDGRIMVLDDDGKRHTNIVNSAATVMFWENRGDPADFIAGNVVICSYPDEID